MSQNLTVYVTAIFHLVLLYALWRFLRPQKDALLKALIDEAVKRAPPVEAQDPKEGVPFEVYRKDLLRMAEGEISIDQFVEIWRGRKVQKRPKPKTAAEEAAEKAAVYFRGQWLRVTNPASPAYRKLVALEEVRGEEIRAEHLIKVGRSNIVSLREGDFENAVPEVGEWWMWTPTGLPEWNPAIWDEVLTEERKKELRKQILDLQLQPNNFGVGLPVHWEKEQANESFKKLITSEAFDIVLREWAFHVKAKTVGMLDDDGTKFGKLVRKWQETEGKLKDSIEAFVAFIEPRTWADVEQALRSHVDPEVRAVFEKEAAGPFYEAFRRVLVHRHSWSFVEPDLPLGKQKCACGEMFEPPKDVKESEIFATINSVIKEFSKGIGDALDLKKFEALLPQAPLPGTSEWVRVTRSSSPAFGLLGQVIRQDITYRKSIVIEVRDIRNERHILQLEPGEFEHPPYPKEGEWWAWHADMQEPSPFVWENKRDRTVSKASEEEYRKQILLNIEMGTLFPFNFGRGA